MKSQCKTLHCYNEGVQARTEGKLQYTNPYLLASQRDEWANWRWGWDQEDRYRRGVETRITA